MAYVTKGQKADYELVKARIDGYYPDLAECQMTYGILLAHPSADNPERPPLVSRGFPVTGKVDKSNPSERMLGAPDVTFTFDAPHWDNLDDEGKAAEADHWLYRLLLQRDKKTKVYKTDDAHRPVFKMRAHDKEVGVYDEIVRRHGRKAPESQAVEELSLHYNTLLPVDGNGGGQEEDADQPRGVMAQGRAALEAAVDDTPANEKLEVEGWQEPADEEAA